VCGVPRGDPEGATVDGGGMSGHRKPARHKYGAVATVVNGIRFDSKAEARRYGELQLLVRAGQIHGLLLQPVFVLHAHGPHGVVKVGKYVCDFAYQEQGALVYEDVKGVATPLYRWKRKHCEAEHGVTIREVRYG
jgi:hypothetical protein